MFCGECGTQNPDTNQFCKNCGKPLRRPQQAPAAHQVATPVPPVAAPSQPQPVYYPLPPTGVQPPEVVADVPVKPSLEKRMLLLDVLSILLGAVSWFVYPYICGVLAIVLGAVVLYNSRNKKGIWAIIVAILGITGIIIGLASIMVNLFYFSFYPSVEVPL
jgi:hypothetical protein